MRLSFGRYIPYNSLIHKLDPRLKLVMMIALISCIFFRQGYTGYIFIGTVVLILFVMSRLKFNMLWRLAKPIFFMVAFLFLINCFLLKPTSANIGHYWGGGTHGGVSWFTVSEQACFQAIYLGIRIYFLIILTTILTSTTKPLDLTNALEDIMWPLKFVKFPVHIVAMIIAIALRMIPTLIEEAGRIMKAQASRGIDFRNGQIKDKVRSSVSLIIPLLVSAFQKAEDLAYAMDSRGYNPKSKRTRYRSYPFKAQDLVIFFLVIGFVAFSLSYVYAGIIPDTNPIKYLDKFIIS